MLKPFEQEAALIGYTYMFIATRSRRFGPITKVKKGESFNEKLPAYKINGTSQSLSINEIAEGEAFLPRHVLRGTVHEPDTTSGKVEVSAIANFNTSGDSFRGTFESKGRALFVPGRSSARQGSGRVRLEHTFYTGSGQLNIKFSSTSNQSGDAVITVKRRYRVIYKFSSSSSLDIEPIDVFPNTKYTLIIAPQMADSGGAGAFHEKTDNRSSFSASWSFPLPSIQTVEFRPNVISVLENQSAASTIDLVRLGKDLDNTITVNVEVLGKSKITDDFLSDVSKKLHPVLKLFRKVEEKEIKLIEKFVPLPGKYKKTWLKKFNTGIGDFNDFNSIIDSVFVDSNDLSVSDSSVTFEPSTITKELDIIPINDEKTELEQIAFLKLSSNAPNVITGKDALVTIIDDDRSFFLIGKDDLSDLAKDLIIEGIIGALIGGPGGFIINGLKAAASSIGEILIKTKIKNSIAKGVVESIKKLYDLDGESTPKSSSLNLLEADSFATSTVSASLSIPIEFKTAYLNNSGVLVGIYSQLDKSESFLIDGSQSISPLKTNGEDDFLITDINEGNQVVGISAKDASALLFSEDTFIPLQGLGGSFSYASAVNDNNQVVGNSENSLGVTKPVIWSNVGTPTVIKGFQNDAAAIDINDSSQIIGYEIDAATGTLRGFFWDSGKLRTLPSLATIRDERILENFDKPVSLDSSSPIPADEFNLPIAINNLGQVIGISLDTNGSPQAYLWENGTLISLAPEASISSYPLAINAKGQVILVYDPPAEPGDDASVSQGVLWDNGLLVDLGTLGGEQTIPIDINNEGQIVGISTTNSGDVIPFLWDDGNLSTLKERINLDPDLELIKVLDINDVGQVVTQSFDMNGNVSTNVYSILEV